MSAHEIQHAGFDPRKLMAALTVFAREVGGDALKRTVVVAKGEVIFSGPLLHDPMPIGRSTRVLTSTAAGIIPAVTIDEISAQEVMKGNSAYGAVGDPDSLSPFLRDRQVQNAESAWNRLAFELTLEAGKDLESVLRETVPAAADWHQFSWNHFGLRNGLRINGGAGNHDQGATMTPFEWATFGWFVHQAFCGKEWTDWTPWLRESLQSGYGWDPESGAYTTADSEKACLVVAPDHGFVIARMGALPDRESLSRLISAVILAAEEVQKA